MGLISLALRHSKLPIVSSGRWRIAQLTAANPFEGSRLFPAERWKDLGAFAPSVLVGPASELQRLMRRMDLNTLQLTSVDGAIFVLTDIGDEPLTETFRAALWQRFGVPIYQVCVDWTGRVLAFECEAQNGWHVEAGVHLSVEKHELVLHTAGRRLLKTGIHGYLEARRCACGRAGVRIMELDADCVEEMDPVLAAIA